VEIYDIDEAVRKYSAGSDVKTYDELIEKIIRGFNGDDAYILKELSSYDRSGRGRLSTH